MKNWVVLFSILFYFGCQVNETEVIPEILNEETFDLVVPEQFSWSTISQDILLVNIVSDSVKTCALDSTTVELYNSDGDLLDALIIFKGQAGFNFRVPVTENTLKVKVCAANRELEFSSKVRSINFEIPDASSIKIKRIDTDGDGLYDKYDYDPRDPNIAIVVDNINPGEKSSSKKGIRSYYIFEDLWPSKGDYDFNDFIAGTSFSWKRGKNNYIQEISGICDMSWKSPGFGFGFEIFEAKGAYLIYMDEIISKTSGDAILVDSITNGIKLMTATQNIGTDSKVFTLDIKDHSLTDFVCIPFLFRNDNVKHQIRPFGIPPTQIQKMRLFKSADDDSPNDWEWRKGKKFKYPLEGNDAFYRTKESYPWGIEFLAKDYSSNVEGISILSKYPGFKNWAESGGTIEGDWYNHPVYK